jgi:hypothetical protein
MVVTRKTSWIYTFSIRDYRPVPGSLGKRRKKIPSKLNLLLFRVFKGTVSRVVDEMIP